MEYSRSTRPNQAADLKTQYVPVAIGEGKHPAPFRTRKLSPLPPMVLLWRRSGRVGRRRAPLDPSRPASLPDRKSTRLNSSHSQISYAVFCLNKKAIRDP